jgi:hypothetical protein
MKGRRVRMSLLRSPMVAAFVALALHAPAVRAANADVLGRWSCVAQSPEGELPSVWVIKESAGALVVEVEIDGVRHAVQDVKVTGRVLSMKVPYQSTLYDVAATFDGDTLQGTWSGDGRQGPVRGKRV